MNLVEMFHKAVANRNQIATQAVAMIRTAHAAASHPDAVIAGLAKTVAKRSGVVLQDHEADMLGKMVVRGIKK